MKILFFGDIVGKVGRQAFKKALPEITSEFKPDFLIVNGENASHGKGLGESAYNFLVDQGVDCITLGDHAFDRSDSFSILDNDNSKVIRPANFPNIADIPGVGMKIIEKQSGSLGVINLQGRVFMKEGTDNPFTVINQLLDDPKLDNIPIIVDFHSEATSEITAMGWYLDGKVSAVLGTHTHVQTNDARVLPGGTGYISDVGMVGPRDSVLGVRKEIIISKFVSGLPAKHEVADMPAIVSYVEIELADNKTVKISNKQKIVE